MLPWMLVPWGGLPLDEEFAEAPCVDAKRVLTVLAACSQLRVYPVLEVFTFGEYRQRLDIDRFWFLLSPPHVR